MGHMRKWWGGQGVRMRKERVVLRSYGETYLIKVVLGGDRNSRVREVGYMWNYFFVHIELKYLVSMLYVLKEIPDN